MTHCLVTGGAGFIGSHIAETLVKQNYQVTVLDNLSTGQYKNMEAFRSEITFIEGDLSDENLLKKILQNVDIIFHQAAAVSVPKSIEDPWSTHHNNANGTLRLLIAAAGANVKRVVYASSSSVYGDSLELPKNEQMPTNPISPYGISKLVGEQYCQTFSRIYKLQTVVLRYFNVFGPRQNVHSQYSAVIPKFIDLALKQQSPVIFGDGEQTRDFTYIENIVEGNLLAATKPDISGKIFNVALGNRVSLNQMLEMLSEVLGKNITPQYKSARSGDIKHSVANIALAKDILGYTPKISFRNGLEKTVAWYCS